MSRENLDSRKFEKAEVIFQILLNDPGKFEVASKPSADRDHNFMCTLDMKKIPIASARVDDNGAYTRRGNSTKLFCC